MRAVLEALPGPATAPAGRPDPGADVPQERRILERCAREIALEAGGGARVVAVGGRPGRGVVLLAAAIAALGPTPPSSARRRVVFLSVRRTSRMSDTQLAATLHRIGQVSAADALLVVGMASAGAGSLARFARLAAATAWEQRQLWSDAGAAFALHVLARSGTR